MAPPRARGVAPPRERRRSAAAFRAPSGVAAATGSGVRGAAGGVGPRAARLARLAGVVAREAVADGPYEAVGDALLSAPAPREAGAPSRPCNNPEN